ncbi:hypothetical protein Hanom_Chr02g00161551 [Helianthus anomalus]
MPANTYEKSQKDIMRRTHLCRIETILPPVTKFDFFFLKKILLSRGFWGSFEVNKRRVPAM